MNPLDPTLGYEWSDDTCDACGEPRAAILWRERREDGASCPECAEDSLVVLTHAEGWEDACCPEVVESPTERCSRCEKEIARGICFHGSEWPVFCDRCVHDLANAAAAIDEADDDLGYVDFWYSDGKPASARDYGVDYEEPHGTVREWWPTGQLRRLGVYDQGKPVGVWRQWSRDESLDLEYDFGGTP